MLHGRRVSSGRCLAFVEVFSVKVRAGCFCVWGRFRCFRNDSILICGIFSFLLDVLCVTLGST